MEQKIGLFLLLFYFVLFVFVSFLQCVPPQKDPDVVVTQKEVARYFFLDVSWEDGSWLLSFTYLRSQQPERLNNIQEAHIEIIYPQWMFIEECVWSCAQDVFISVPEECFKGRNCDTDSKKWKKGNKESQQYFFAFVLNWRQDIERRPVCNFSIFIVWYLKNLINYAEQGD